MQMSLISQNEQEYFLRSRTSDGAHQIMKALSIRELPDLIPSKAINLHLKYNLTT
jgi:hypothetical protein